MNVDHPARIVLHKPRREDAHEARQHDQRGLVPINLVLKCGIKCFARFKFLVINHLRCQAQRFGA